MNEIIKKAVANGAVLYSNVSGGKDSQAMTKVIAENFAITGFIHADLGRTEWKESMGMCEKLAKEFGSPLHIVTRADGKDMLAQWQSRMMQLMGTGKPFWSSSKNRYCTSDLKRDPIDKFYRNCGHDFIISCEGIRASESTGRSKKKPLEIRKRITAKYYEGMMVEEAIANFKPGHRLAITWFPIFDFSLADVWATYGMNDFLLRAARGEYEETGIAPEWWPFHPAYAYGNNRVSCMFCILGIQGDLENAAKHNPELLSQMIEMEEMGAATFKDGWSLKSLLPAVAC